MGEYGMMQAIETTVEELKALRKKQGSQRARVYLEWAIENLEKYLELGKEEGVLNTSKRQ
jgi:hypothetical protein